MPEPATAEPPLVLDRIERARGDGDRVRLRLSGRWLGPGEPGDHEALLVIQLQGRRHRFPALAEDDGSAAELPGTWQAEFAIPPWAVPTRAGQAAVWVGNAVIAVGPPGSAVAPPAGATPEPEPEPPGVAGVPATPDPAAPGGEGDEPAPPRSGPLADLLLKETVAALHAELERRSAEAAQLRGALADAHSELEARAARQATLEAAHGELRHELEQLMDAVARQRRGFEDRSTASADEVSRLREELVLVGAGRDAAEAALAAAREQAAGLRDQMSARGSAERELAQETASLREQLATAHISRDAAVGEAGGLRAELERLGAELAVTREQMTAHGGDLGEAQRLLADARALTEQLRGESPA
jgi:hypothetical protein